MDKVYYFYEDHIGRPILMTEYKNYDAGAGGDYNMVERYDTDDCGQSYDVNNIWRTNYTPFGVDDYSFDSSGIDVGSSEDNCAYKLDDWMPPFRFPGQYSDPELLDKFVYNHWRFYMPEVGRYTGPDKLDFHEGLSPYLYAMSNPVTMIDPLGLYRSFLPGTPTHASILGDILKELNVNCGNKDLLKGVERPDAPGEPSCPLYASEAEKKYWHFSSPDVAIFTLDSTLLLLLDGSGRCNPLYYGMHLHRLMDSFSHYLKWGYGGPKEYSHPKKRPIGVPKRRSPDDFVPDADDAWGYIDYAMQINLRYYVNLYNMICCQ